MFLSFPYAYALLVLVSWVLILPTSFSFSLSINLEDMLLTILLFFLVFPLPSTPSPKFSGPILDIGPPGHNHIRFRLGAFLCPQPSAICHINPQHHPAEKNGAYLVNCLHAHIRGTRSWTRRIPLACPGFHASPRFGFSRCSLIWTITATAPRRYIRSGPQLT
jgi:hypothetical protein